ncbi:Uncharacterized membrane protein [Rhizobiales bacterium GAS188]|nr:Uncharacterized membrane protein [Rhizobiales bacterium GAS188]
MSLASEAPPAPARFVALDAARGAALVAMVVFHCAFDLDSLGLAELGVDTTPSWRWFARLIAGSFLALAGVSMVVAHRRRIRWDAYFRRLAILAGAAALVTLATWYGMPRKFIFFGILHMIVVASLIGLVFLRAPWPVTLAAALLALLVPSLLASSLLEPSLLAQGDVAWPWLDAPWLRWLGLGTTLPATLDYEPVFPWLFPFLLGMAAARLALPRFAASAAASWQPLAFLPRALAFAGRHSLAIYLIHQPVMFGTLSVVAQLTVNASAVPDEDRPFIEACRTTCLARGGDGRGCVAYCGCTASELKKAGLWMSVLADRLTPEERQRLGVAMQVCARTGSGGNQP